MIRGHSYSNAKSGEELAQEGVDLAQEAFEAACHGEKIEIISNKLTEAFRKPILRDMPKVLQKRAEIATRYAASMLVIKQDGREFEPPIPLHVRNVATEVMHANKVRAEAVADYINAVSAAGIELELITTVGELMATRINPSAEVDLAA